MDNYSKYGPVTHSYDSDARYHFVEGDTECLDWTLIWNQGQLDRVLTAYLRHYNAARPHRSLDLQPPRPVPRLTLVEPGGESPVHRVDVLGGLIHEYRLAA
ncbi:MAG: putative transposase [Micromonosporaceae bacterium]